MSCVSGRPGHCHGRLGEVVSKPLAWAGEEGREGAGGLSERVVPLPSPGAPWTGRGTGSRSVLAQPPLPGRLRAPEGRAERAAGARGCCRFAREPGAPPRAPSPGGCQRRSAVSAVAASVRRRERAREEAVAPARWLARRPRGAGVSVQGTAGLLAPVAGRRDTEEGEGVGGRVSRRPLAFRTASPRSRRWRGGRGESNRSPVRPAASLPGPSAGGRGCRRGVADPCGSPQARARRCPGPVRCRAERVRAPGWGPPCPGRGGRARGWDLSRPAPPPLCAHGDCASPGAEWGSSAPTAGAFPPRPRGPGSRGAQVGGVRGRFAEGKRWPLVVLGRGLRAADAGSPSSCLAQRVPRRVALGCSAPCAWRETLPLRRPPCTPGLARRVRVDTRPWVQAAAERGRKTAPVRLNVKICACWGHFFHVML